MMNIDLKSELESLRAQQAAAPTGKKGQFGKRIRNLEWTMSINQLHRMNYQEYPDTVRACFENFIESPNGYTAHNFAESCESENVDQHEFQIAAGRHYASLPKAVRTKYRYALYRDKKTRFQI